MDDGRAPVYKLAQAWAQIPAEKRDHLWTAVLAIVAIVAISAIAVFG